MRVFVRAKLLLLLTSLLVLIATVPLTVIAFRLQAVHATATSKGLKKQYTSSRTFNSTIPDWSEFHGDAARDGNLSTNTNLSKANAKSLVPVSGPGFTSTGSVEGSPASYQGIVYYAANKPVADPTGTLHISTMYAVDATTGQTVWSEQFPACRKLTRPEYTSSSPAVTSGLVNGVLTTEVFIGWGTDNSGKPGCIYDFNGLDGTLIWSFKTNGVVYSSPGIMSTSNGNLVVVGDDDNYIHAFSVNYNGSLGGKGVEVWSYSNANDPPPPGYSQYCLPAPELCGDAVWSSPAEGLVMVNNQPHHYLYFAIGAEKNTVGRVDAIDMDTIVNNSPTLAWAFWDPHPQDNNDFGDVLVLTDANGFATRVYSGNNSGDMFGVDGATGAMYFDFNTTAQYGVNGRIVSTGALVTINGTTELIFSAGCASTTCLSSGGSVWAIDALSTQKGGTVLWRSQNFGNHIVSSPIVANQGTNAVVFIMGPWRLDYASHGDLIALDPVTGATLADYPVFNHAYGTVSSPAIYGNRVFVTEGYNTYGSSNPGGGGLAAFQCSAC